MCRHGGACLLKSASNARTEPAREGKGADD